MAQKKPKPIDQMTLPELLALEAQIKAEIAESDRADHAHQERLRDGYNLVMYAGNNSPVRTDDGVISSTEFVRQHLDAGAPIDFRNHEGTSSLHNASLYGNNDMVQLLLDRGASVNIQNHHGDTPLMLAKSAATAQILLAAGADVNSPNSDGNTALHIRARREDSESVQLLLRSGADATLVNRKGETAEHVAVGDAKDVLTTERVERERGQLRQVVGLDANQDEPVQRHRKM